MDKFKSLKEQCEFEKWIDTQIVLRLIQTIEQQQEELNYYKMKHENTGAVMSRSHLLTKIQEKDAEIERLKDELDNIYFELRTR